MSLDAAQRLLLRAVLNRLLPPHADLPGAGDLGADGSIERTLGERTLRTKDLGGNADTGSCGKAVAEMVE